MKMVGLNDIPNEIKIRIFHYVRFPQNLAISCKLWSILSKDYHVRAEWIILQYGCAHCLFHAIRLGPKFMNIDVAREIIIKGGILTKYFAQRLLRHFGNYDQKLIEMWIEYDERQSEIDSLQQNNHWASNLQLQVFTFLLNKASDLFKDLSIRGNDMEKFYLLSGGPLANTISSAQIALKENKEAIKDLILNMKFIPFPQRKFNDIQTNLSEEFSLDGYENNRYLNIIARTILIDKEFVNLWKDIGYHEICDDFNDLVYQGAFIMLFSSNTPIGRKSDAVKMVVEKLKELDNLGFKLNNDIIISIFHLFEHRLEETSEILIESFREIKKESDENFLITYQNSLGQGEFNLRILTNLFE